MVPTHIQVLKHPASLSTLTSAPLNYSDLILGSSLKQFGLFIDLNLKIMFMNATLLPLVITREIIGNVSPPHQGCVVVYNPPGLVRLALFSVQ